MDLGKNLEQSMFETNVFRKVANMHLHESKHVRKLPENIQKLLQVPEHLQKRHPMWAMQVLFQCWGSSGFSS